MTQASAALDPVSRTFAARTVRRGSWTALPGVQTLPVIALNAFLLEAVVNLAHRTGAIARLPHWLSQAGGVFLILATLCLLFSAAFSVQQVLAALPRHRLIRSIALFGDEAPAARELLLAKDDLVRRLLIAPLAIPVVAVTLGALALFTFTTIEFVTNGAHFAL